MEIQTVKINDAALQQTLLLARRELQMRKKRSRIGFPRFVWLQIRYFGWKIWLMQAVLLLGVQKFLQKFYGNESLCTPKRIAMLLCGFSILLAMSAIPFLYRSFRYRMAEIEVATRFSMVRLILARLLMIGIGDAMTIGSVIWLTAANTSYSIWHIGLYAVVPFLLVCTGELALMRYLMKQNKTMAWG
jgi:hypothetical protein